MQQHFSPQHRDAGKKCIIHRVLNGHSSISICFFFFFQALVHERKANQISST